MPTDSFTAQIEADLKARLEEIARFGDRSASSLANQAIHNFVEERIPMRELFRAGLALIESEADGVAPDAVHRWLLADDEQPFPGAQPEA